MPVIFYFSLNKLNERVALVIAGLWITSFQPYFWSKTLTVDFWHIFFGIVSVCLLFNIISSPNKRTYLFYLWIVVSIIAIVVRPPFIVFTIVQAATVLFYAGRKYWYGMILVFTFVLCIFGVWSLLVSSFLPLHRSTADQNIGISRIQELVFYDFLTSRLPSVDDQILVARLKELKEKNNEKFDSVFSDIVFSKAASLSVKTRRRKEDQSAINHRAYFDLKETIVTDKNFDPNFNRSVVRILIDEIYLRNPRNMFRFIWKYSTYIFHTLSAKHFIYFNKYVRETPFYLFDRKNGPNSRILYEYVKNWVDLSTEQEIVAQLGTNYLDEAFYPTGWVDQDQEMFSPKRIHWMALYNILNSKLGPLESALLIRGVNQELVWRGQGDIRDDPRLVVKWLGDDSPIMGKLKTAAYHMYHYHLRPRTNDFTYYWEFLFCLQPSMSVEYMSYGRWIDVKPLNVGVPKYSSGEVDVFDRYLHLFWEATRFVFLGSVALFFFLFYFGLSKEHRFFGSACLMMIFAHSAFEMWFMGSHFKYTDHTLFISWIFVGCVVSGCREFVSGSSAARNH